MPRILVWDLPTRLFHWLLVAGFLMAAVIAFLAGEHSPLFPYHALIGLVLVPMVILRIVWGGFGSRYARFSSFMFGPREVVRYFAGVLSGRGNHYVGHNPGAAYAIVAMLVLVLGIAGTGVMLGAGYEIGEELHEVLVYILLLVVGVHVLGVLLHTVRHRENITGSMVHGRKTGDPAEGISSRHFFAAGVFMLTTAAWSCGLFNNYNSSSQSTILPVFRVMVRVGETEKEREHEREHQHELSSVGRR